MCILYFHTTLTYTCTSYLCLQGDVTWKEHRFWISQWGWGLIPFSRRFWCFPPHPPSAYLWFQLQLWKAALWDLLHMPTGPTASHACVPIWLSGRSILWILEWKSQHNKFWGMKAAFPRRLTEVSVPQHSLPSFGWMTLEVIWTQLRGPGRAADPRLWQQLE